MNVFTENHSPGAYLVSEANGQRSRKMVELASGSLQAGTVLALDGGGKYVMLDPSASGTKKTAVAVLYSATDATASAQKCVVHAGDCEVDSEALIWPAGITSQQITDASAALADAGIIVR